MAHPLQEDGYQVRRWLGQEPWGPSNLAVDADENNFTVHTLELRRLGVPVPAEDDEGFARFADTIKAIRHPVLAPIHDIILRDELVYVVEDFIYDQRPLAAILHRQRFIAPESAWKLACQLCHGAHFMHERGIYHLRLSPDCIMIGRKGLDARITGCGVLALLNHLEPNLDREPWVSDWVCPDWLEGGEPAADCDTYSIAVTIRSALENGPEWNAKETALREEVRRFAFLEVQKEITQLEAELQRPPPVSDDPAKWVQLRRVINDAAHPDPEERFSTAALLGKAIAAARHEDEFGPREPVKTAEQEAEDQRERAKPRRLVGEGVLFCQICGRPATQGERNCKSCNAPLSQRVEAAIEQAADVLDVDLDEVDDWFAEVGEDMAARGKTTEAEKAYRIAVYRHREDARCWKDLADMYCINRKFPQALQSYWNAARLKPNDPALRVDLGLAYLAVRRPEDAQREFTWVLNSRASNDLRLAALTHLGTAFAMQKRHMEAVDIWRSVLEERPFDVGVRCSMASSYIALHNYPRAYEHIKLAARANPDSPTAQLALRHLDRMAKPAWARWSRETVMYVRLPLLLMFIVAGAFAGIQGGGDGPLVGALGATFMYLTITGLVELVMLLFSTDYGLLLDRLLTRRARGTPEARDE